MESIIATLLKRYESGGVSRRELIQGLAALATTAAATTPVAAAGFQVTHLDHVQINCSDAKRSSAFYQKVFGLSAVRVGAGWPDETEELSHIAVGNNLIMALRKRTPAGQVDHIGFRVPEGLKQEAIVADLKARGVEPAKHDLGGLYVKDPDGVLVQLNGVVPTKPY